MATVTYEPVEPTLIENTTMQILYIDGVARVYTITPVEGYVLHDKGRDWIVMDPITGEEIPYLGYTTGTATCAMNYDFNINPREFYAVLETSVPADQIFGIHPDHETA